MAIINLISMEFYKLKGNRTFLITTFGALLLPLLFVILSLLAGVAGIVDSMNAEYGFYLSLFNIIFATVIINYLFTVDVDTRALKSIIPLPVSRREYVISKLLTLFIWMIVLALITIISSFIMFTLVGMTGFDLNAILQVSGNFIFCTVLLFLVMIPLAFVIMYTGNQSASLVISVLLIFLNLMSSIEQTKYSPWLLPSAIFNGTLQIPEIMAYAIIIITALVGYVLILRTIYSRDIPL